MYLLDFGRELTLSCKKSRSSPFTEAALSTAMSIVVSLGADGDFHVVRRPLLRHVRVGESWHSKMLLLYAVAQLESTLYGFE